MPQYFGRNRPYALTDLFVLCACLLPYWAAGISELLLDRTNAFEPRFYTPSFSAILAAQTPIKKLPFDGAAF